MLGTARPGSVTLSSLHKRSCCPVGECPAPRGTVETTHYTTPPHLRTLRRFCGFRVEEASELGQVPLPHTHPELSYGVRARTQADHLSHSPGYEQSGRRATLPWTQLCKEVSRRGEASSCSCPRGARGPSVSWRNCHQAWWLLCHLSQLPASSRLPG